MTFEIIPATSLLDELDHYDITRPCRWCAHWKSKDGRTGNCTSLGMVEMIRGFTGIHFTEDVCLPVSDKTDAGLCSEFLLSASESVRLEISDTIDSARLQARRHADHYSHLRRPSHAH